MKKDKSEEFINFLSKVCIFSITVKIFGVLGYMIIVSTVGIIYLTFNQKQKCSLKTKSQVSQIN